MKKPTMPNVRSRTLLSGKITYFLDYVDILTDTRKRLAVGSRKSDAHKKAKDIYDQMMARFVGEPNVLRSEVGLDDLIESFFRGREGRNAVRTIKRYRVFAGHFQDFMAANFKKVHRASEVQRVYLEELLSALSKAGQEARTLNAELHFLKMLFKYAVEEGFVADNPAQRIKPFRETKKAESVQFWSEDEVRKILATVRSHWRPIFEFLYLTGLRKGELIHLTWKDVNLSDDQPTITVQAKEDWVTKTVSRRIVPLNDRAVEILKAQNHVKNHNRVFCGADGGFVHPDKIYVELKRALRHLGLTGDVHQWRHTFASHLVMKGQGLETVSKLLGHASIEMTMKYAHLAPAHLRSAVKELPRLSDD
ncbi:MAG: site-specific integrase [Calditrichaeota bacterium]|nr:site-specific integrase [Calditrichota bacterium]